MQTSCGVQIRNKKPSTATFSDNQGWALLCLHRVRIRWDHAGKRSRCCWWLWDKQLLVGSSRAAFVSLPWLSFLFPLFFSFTAFISLSHCFYPLLHSCCAISGEGMSSLCQEQSEAVGEELPLSTRLGETYSYAGGRCFPSCWG